MGILTYKGRDFYMDGEKYTVFSGAMHYFRIPKEYWYDRLLKLKECGFNTVETYTPWNLHEPKEGEFDFSGNLDLEAYIKMAENLGLNVIVRPGPYICAEWEFGGLPAWLLTYEKMTLRCYDPLFLSKLSRYLKVILSKIRPHLASQGGNVIMLQIENEYGSYGNDKDYLRAIAKIYEEAGMDCLCFTSDGPYYTMLSGGTLPEYLAVENFGSKPETWLSVLAEYRPDQPLMCGEYWCGWFDHWFEEHHTRSAEEIASDFEGFFRAGASFNFYMFHGGTNFGFMNGANYGEKYEPTVTSYDYCAPLNEAGDRTPTYYAVRDVIAKYVGKAPALTATETPKKAYGKIALTECADLFENLDRIAKPVHSASPKFMEELGQSYGYVLYRTHLQGPHEEGGLVIEPVHDRAEIFFDGEYKGVYTRWAPPKEEELVRVPLGKGDELRLDILVENMGRVNYGHKIRDRKGIESVRLGYVSIQHHFGWDMYSLPMEEELAGLVFSSAEAKQYTAPTFFRGTLEIEDTPADTFIRLDGFHKGFVKINGVNIGRYFNDAGPQKTLFVPAPFLKRGKNEILVFESDATDVLSVTFTDIPDLG